MNTLFDETRIYLSEDPEIYALLGNRARQAQLRHHGRAPTYFRLGRKIVYHGADLNVWANAQRFDQSGEA